MANALGVLVSAYDQLSTEIFPNLEGALDRTPYSSSGMLTRYDGGGEYPIVLFGHGSGTSLKTGALP